MKILDSNDAETLFLIMTYSDRQPPRFSWVDFSKHTAGLFKDRRLDQPQADAAGKRDTLQDPRRQGTRCLPHAASGDIEGASGAACGPSARRTLPQGYVGFDGEAQLLASRGYAVVKPNYRASSGYEWKFPEADLFDFVKMSHDVTDVTKAMIATGLVDPTRIAIMGGSFGGYLTLEGLVDEPVYRCGVSISGVYDWAQLMKDKQYDALQYNSTEYGWLLSNSASPQGARQVRRDCAVSASKIRVPVFVSHGGEDKNVDLGQATRLISEFKKLKS